VDVTPNSPMKRTRSKTAKAVASTQAAAAAKPKKSRSRKTQAAEATAPALTAMPTPEEIKEMIAKAAYFLAEERNFSPGHELDDWLEAERRIHATLFG
jgi:hypothetical protein